MKEIRFCTLLLLLVLTTGFSAVPIRLGQAALIYLVAWPCLLLFESWYLRFTDGVKAVLKSPSKLFKSMTEARRVRKFYFFLDGYSTYYVSVKYHRL